MSFNCKLKIIDKVVQSMVIHTYIHAYVIEVVGNTIKSRCTYIHNRRVTVRNCPAKNWSRFLLFSLFLISWFLLKDASILDCLVLLFWVTVVCYYWVSHRHTDSMFYIHLLCYLSGTNLILTISLLNFCSRFNNLLVIFYFILFLLETSMCMYKLYIIDR